MYNFSRFLPGYWSIRLLRCCKSRVTGLVGFSSITIIETAIGASALDNSILIDKTPQEVFRALVNPDNIANISQNIGNVELG